MPDLGCSNDAAVAYDFLTGKGLTDFQAAAIVGNLTQESQLNPRAYAPQERAYGIAQWRLDRWDALQSFAASIGKDPFDLEVQLEFLWRELETTPSLGLAPLRAATTLEDATVAFQDHFERCGVCATDNRIAYAKAALYACPSVKPPATVPVHRGVTTTLIAASMLALTAAAAYGARWIRNIA